MPDAPSPILAIIVIIGLALGVSAILAERRRTKILARVRESWGASPGHLWNVDALASLYRSRCSAEPPADALDDRTWSDLHLDAVLATIDRTESSLGQQALYHRVRTLRTETDLAAFESLVERMATDVDARQRAQVSLSALRDSSGFDVWWIAQPGVLDRQPWQVVYPLLALVMVGLFAWAMYWPGAILIAFAVTLLNVGIRSAAARRFAPLVGPFRQIAAVTGVARSVARVAAGDANPLLEPLRQDLPSLTRLHKMIRWMGRHPSVDGEITATIAEYLNLLLLADVNAVYFASHEARLRGPALFRVAAALGDLDAAISVASFRAGATGWTRPTFVPSGDPASFRELCHPLVADPVANSIDLGPPFGVIVTGSNMSGKTTFIRTVGVNVVLAQTIQTCLASAYRAPVLRVQSCIGRSDDLIAGKSYYLVEVEAVLSMVNASAQGSPHLFLFDELFRGTNTVERIAAGEAVLAELLRDERHFVIAATHDGELVDLLRGTYALFHFADELGSEGLQFTFRMKDGPATTRNAIALLRLHGAPEALVVRATDRAAALDQCGGL